MVETGLISAGVRNRDLAEEYPQWGEPDPLSRSVKERTQSHAVIREHFQRVLRSRHCHSSRDSFFVVEVAEEFHKCRAEIGWGKKSLEYVAVGPLI